MNPAPIELSVVLPAYEEADNLAALLPHLKRELVKITPVHEILVVDTLTARDRTPEVCREQGALYFNREGGNYYGHAVRTGMQKSRGRCVIFMDADGSHSPGFIRQLWENKDAADLVIASRYVSGGKTENPQILILMSQVVNLVFRIILGLPCADVSNSLRLYRGDDLRALRLQCDHFDIVEEILVTLCCLHPGYRIREIPFTFEKRKAGKTKRQLLIFAMGYLVVLYRLYRLKQRALKAQGKTA